MKSQVHLTTLAGDGDKTELPSTPDGVALPGKGGEIMSTTPKFEHFSTDQERCFMECLQVAYDSGHTDHRTGAPHRRDYAKTSGMHHLKLMHAAGVAGLDHQPFPPIDA